MKLTTAQAAEILNLSQRQISRLCRDGILVASKRGRNWEIDPASVEVYKKTPRQPGPPKGYGGRPTRNSFESVIETSAVGKLSRRKLSNLIQPFTTWFIANILGFCLIGILLLLVPSLIGNSSFFLTILILTLPVSFAQWIALQMIQKTSILWNLTIPIGLMIAVGIFQRFPEGILPGDNNESILGIVTGYLLIGLLIGLPQWALLRPQVSGSSLWLLASSFGMAAGLWIALVTDLINQNGLLSLIVSMLLYAAITGVGLSWLLLRDKNTHKGQVSVT